MLRRGPSPPPEGPRPAGPRLSPVAVTVDDPTPIRWLWPSHPERHGRATHPAGEWVPGVAGGPGLLSRLRLGQRQGQDSTGVYSTNLMDWALASAASLCLMWSLPENFTENTMLESIITEWPRFATILESIIAEWPRYVTPESIPAFGTGILLGALIVWWFMRRRVRAAREQRRVEFEDERGILRNGSKPITDKSRI